MTNNNQNDSTAQQEVYGSLERGIAGEFTFSITDIFSEAWAKTKGNKGTLWLAIVIYAVIAVVVSFVVNHLLGFIGIIVPAQPSFSFLYIVPTFLSGLMGAVVIGPLAMGFFMLGLKIATNRPAEVSELFNYYSYVLKLFLTYLFMYAMIILGFCLFVLPGIYLMFAYYLALPLVVEKNLSPWQALEASRKAVTHVWFSMFGFFIIIMVIMIISAIPLGIGLIWTVPMLMIAYGIIYRTIFGVEKTVVVEA